MQTPDGQITDPIQSQPVLITLELAPCMRISNNRSRRVFSVTDDAMQAGLDLSQLEGIIPAIETSHALAVLNDKKFKPDDIVGSLVCGDKDLNTYIDYFNL
jgi:tryptophan synthase beta chain